MQQTEQHGAAEQEESKELVRSKKRNRIRTGKH
jgi:hypothetical protein